MFFEDLQLKASFFMSHQSKVNGVAASTVLWEVNSLEVQRMMMMMTAVTVHQSESL